MVSGRWLLSLVLVALVATSFGCSAMCTAMKSDQAQGVVKGAALAGATWVKTEALDPMTLQLQAYVDQQAGLSDEEKATLKAAIATVETQAAALVIQQLPDEVVKQYLKWVDTVCPVDTVAPAATHGLMLGFQ